MMAGAQSGRTGLADRGVAGAVYEILGAIALIVGVVLSAALAVLVTRWALHM